MRPQTRVHRASHNDLFDEAAKFRAARRLWARLVRERFGAGDATARMRFHTQTGGVVLPNLRLAALPSRGGSAASRLHFFHG